MNFHLTKVSSNVKTGPIPVSTSHKNTCPDACPLKAKGCYALGGPSNIHWKAVTEGKRGTDWAHFVQTIKALPRGQLWRHNQSGDLPLIDGSQQVDGVAVSQLVGANKGKRGFTYTHHDVIDNTLNRNIVKHANDNGFTINLSGNNISHADKLADLDMAPVVVILPFEAPKVSYTPKGRKVVACPAETSDRVTCASCGLCQSATRSYIIGFHAHGVSKKAVNLIAKG